MRSSGRGRWALWGALAAVAVIALAVLVSERQAPALGDPLDLGEPMPAVSLTGPTPPPTPTVTLTGVEPTAEPTPTQTTEIVVPEAPETVPAPSDDDDDDDDDKDDDDG